MRFPPAVTVLRCPGLSEVAEGVGQASGQLCVGRLYIADQSTCGVEILASISRYAQYALEGC